jgi:hypothetical protein
VDTKRKSPWSNSNCHDFQVVGQNKTPPHSLALAK